MSAAKAKGRIFGYARVSSMDQDETIQREVLEAAGCHVVRLARSVKDR